MHRGLINNSSNKNIDSVAQALNPSQARETSLRILFALQLHTPISVGFHHEQELIGVVFSLTPSVMICRQSPTWYIPKLVYLLHQTSRYLFNLSPNLQQSHYFPQVGS